MGGIANTYGPTSLKPQKHGPSFGHSGAVCCTKFATTKSCPWPLWVISNRSSQVLSWQALCIIPRQGVQNKGSTRKSREAKFELPQLFRNIVQPPFPQSQRPAAPHRANPRGTHRGPSTTQGLQPGSPPHHRQVIGESISISESHEEVKHPLQQQFWPPRAPKAVEA